MPITRCWHGCTWSTSTTWPGCSGGWTPRSSRWSPLSASRYERCARSRGSPSGPPRCSSASRVAGAHCCAPAPSEPCMRLIGAHGSSKPRGRCGLACWHPARAGFELASAGGVSQAGSVAVRHAAPVVGDEVLGTYLPAGDAQPPAFPLLWGLGRLVGGEQVVPAEWAATGLSAEQAQVVAVQRGFDPSPPGGPVVDQVGVVRRRRARDQLCRTMGVQANLIRWGTLPRSSTPARFPNTHRSFLALLNLPKYRRTIHRFGWSWWLR